MNRWIILHPETYILGKEEKTKKIKEIINKNQINKRIFNNKTMKYQSK